VHKLKARMMDGDLRLTEASTNFVDTLGRSRVRGNFSAIYNDAKAFDMLLAAHQEFFNRSLTAQVTPTSQPATSPTTHPATHATTHATTHPSSSTTMPTLEPRTETTTRPRGDGMQP
jgi:hypothetical protein